MYSMKCFTLFHKIQDVIQGNLENSVWDNLNVTKPAMTD